MALKVNNQANNQSIAVNPQRALPIFLGAPNVQPGPRMEDLQGNFGQLQPASGNMAKPNNPPPRLGAQRFMSRSGLPMIDYPGPWNYNLNDGAWSATGHAQLARMGMPAFLPQHINPMHPIYTGGQ